MTEIYSINTNTLGVSKYEDLSSIAFVDMDGELVSMSSTALYEHSGDDDDGTDIDCHLETGQMFFSTINDKRCTYITANVAHSSELTISLVLPDLSQSEGNLLYYPCTAARQQGISSTGNYPLDFKPPRGVSASTLGFKVSNVDGGSFAVNKLKTRVTDVRLK